MPRNIGGAIVIQQPNPWGQALQGLGAGAGMIGQALLQKKTKEKETMEDITGGTATGKYRPEFWASKEAEDYLRSAGVWDKPEIQGLVTRARAGMGLGAPPDVATQMPVAPGDAFAAAGAGGGVVNVPQPAPEPPDAKTVNEYLYKEDERKKLALYELQRKASGAQQILNYQAQEDIRLDRIKSLPEQLDVLEKTLKSQGLQRNEYALSYSEEGGLSWTIRPESVDRITGFANKKAKLFTDFEDTVSRFNDKRLAQVVRLKEMLNNDLINPKALKLGDDEESKWIVEAIASYSSEKDPKKRVILQVDAVNHIIKQYNGNIKQYRRVIQAAGEQGGADQATITDRFTKDVTFEDVSGGLSPEEYRKRKGVIPEANDLISEVRKDYSGNSVVAPRPSDVSAKDAATKVQESFNAIKDVVASALKENPSLTPDQIKQVMFQNKDQIMAEYGLNERLFSLLMSMSDKVLG